MILPSQTTVTLAPAATTVTKNVNIQFMNDNLSSVTAQVQYDDGTIQNLTLWNSNSTPSYESVGNWTQSQANDRVVWLVTGGVF